MLKPLLAIALGSTLGGFLRWLLSLKLNLLWPQLAAGTLIANLIAGYFVGLAAAYFLQAPQISPEWRLLIITGFCGGLSTFSTFSLEVVTLLEQGRLAWAAATIALHVFGSLLMTLAGLTSWRYLSLLKI